MRFLPAIGTDSDVPASDDDLDSEAGVAGTAKVSSRPWYFWEWLTSALAALIPGLVLGVACVVALKKGTSQDFEWSDLTETVTALREVLRDFIEMF
jgi:hypothetical protein